MDGIKKGKTMRILLMLLIMLSSTAYAEQKEVLCVIGEAEGEGFEGMYAVAHGLRNRGHLKGVYGCNAPRVINKMYSSKTLDLARKAWADSKLGEDPTKGATLWENVVAFGKPSWYNGVEITSVIGSHTFFKEKKYASKKKH
jgi:spore germination cell wall hydrolase CwlJ-like protein